METQDITLIYKKLPETLVSWYLENARDLPWRKDQEPYHIWISEIMLQQTRVEAVKGYYYRFLEAFPDIYTLAKASEEKLLKMWEGLGYYNRAKNLQKAARIIVEELNGDFPTEYQELLKLPGIGEYTAGAVASISFGEPVAAVDGNVLRVISRITENFQDISKTSTKKTIKLALESVYPKKNPGIFTQSLIELGALICIPIGAPKCERCPASSFCLARIHGTQQQLPVKNTKKERRIEERTVFLLESEHDIAIQKRSSKGLLAGLWQFPNVVGKNDAKGALQIVEQWGCRPTSIIRQVEAKHIFSHVQWDMVCYYIPCDMCEGDFLWIDKRELNTKYALPTAFKQFVSILNKD